MVREGKVFGHKVSEKGSEINTSGLEPLEQLPKPQDLEGLQNFIVHVGFYRCFKDFATIAAP
jgi:hypothetical protein